MFFFRRIIKKLFFFEQYLSVYQDIKALLTDSGVVLFLLNTKDFSLLSGDSHDLTDMIRNDEKFQEMLKLMVSSLCEKTKTIQSCININKKYYNLSISYVKKRTFLNHYNKYIICIGNDITDQVNTHHITLNAYHEQLRMNKMKTAFLSRMSHEFRTPLNAVIGFSDAIKHKLHGDIPDAYLEYIDNIHLAGNHLLDIVNDIMDVSLQEHTECLLHISAFSPIKAIETILQFTNCLLVKQKIIVNLHHELSDDFLIRNDLNVFKRIFINIIGNVCKYCPENTEVTIKISCINSVLYIYVDDNGFGFPRNVIDNFGVPFNIGDNFLTNTQNAIGLGLSIIKNSIQAMNGTVRIYNHHNGGAVIYIQIPCDVTHNADNYDIIDFQKKAS